MHDELAQALEIAERWKGRVPDSMKDTISGAIFQEMGILSRALLALRTRPEERRNDVIDECVQACSKVGEELGNVLVQMTERAHNRREGQYAGIAACEEALLALKVSPPQRGQE